MTNSISSILVEVTKNIHDTVIMASWQPTSKPTTWQFNLILKLSSCHDKDIFNNVIFAFKMSLLSKRHLMTVINMK